MAFLLALTLIIPSVLAFETERPSVNVDYGDARTDSAYSDGVGDVGLGIHIYQYQENHQDRGDNVEMRVVATANSREILSYGASTASYTWYTVSNPTNVAGDNEVRWVSFAPHKVRFYGGRRSAEYGGAYVSSNGFISFDSDFNIPHNSRGIPHTDTPNSVIAPFWRDLDPSMGGSGSITWGYVIDVPAIVISWNNVPNKVNGEPQTFQIVLEIAPGSNEFYRNSRIWFNYQSITKDDSTTIGVEDQRGSRGVSYNYQDINNSVTLRFQQTSNSAFIQYLTIKLNKGSDAYAIIDINEDPDWIRGHNVRLREETVDETQKFLVALAGEAALLLGSTGVGAKAGFLLGVMAIGLDVVAHLASAQKPANLFEIQDRIDQSYAKAPAYGRPDYLTVVDADVGINVFWMFTDSNNRDHELTITAELEYAEVDYTGNVVACRNITTSVPVRFLRESEPKRISIPTRIAGSVHTDDSEDSLWYFLGGTNFYHKITLRPHVDVDLKLELYEYNPDTCTIGCQINVSDVGGTGQIESITEGPFMGAYTYRLVKVIYKNGPQRWYDLEIYKEPWDGGEGGGGGGGGWPPPYEMLW